MDLFDDNWNGPEDGMQGLANTTRPPTYFNIAGRSIGVSVLGGTPQVETKVLIAACWGCSYCLGGGGGGGGGGQSGSVRLH